MTNSGKKCILALIAAAVVAAVYAAASWPNRFVYDDHEVIENQYAIHGFADLAQIFREPHYLNFPYYRPITRTTFALQKTIWGDSPRPYHLFNAILAGLLMLGAYALLRRPGFLLGPISALLAAIWFSLHPALSECVYPAASGRETLLPALVILLACWAYLGTSRASYWLSMGLFAIGLLCKEQAAVLPGIFFLADVLIRPAPGTVKKWLLRYLPQVVILAAYFWLRHLVFKSPSIQWTAGEHPLEPLYSFLYGLQTAVAPFTELHYEPTLSVWLDGTLVTVASIVLLLLIAATLSGGPALRKAGLFWLGWFVLLQLPTAHLFKQEAPYSERYAALSILAFPAVAAAVLLRWRRLSARTAAAAAVAIWILGFGWVSFLRSSYYFNDDAFGRQWADTNPASASAHNGMALYAQTLGDWKTAQAQYQTALQLDPDSATAHNNLANLLADHGDVAGAGEHYEWLLAHSQLDPAAVMVNYAQTLGNEAFAIDNKAMSDRAKNLLQQAIALRPNYAQAHYVLGLWEETFGTQAEAMEQYRQALSLDPERGDVRKHVALLEALAAAKKANQAGDAKSALAEYQKAVEIDPQSAAPHSQLAILLAAQGQLDAAIEQYEWLLRHDGKNGAQVRIDYAQFLDAIAFKKKDREMAAQARILLLNAIEHWPNNAQAHYDLGVWEDTYGTPQAAIGQFREVVRLNPRRLDAKARIKILETIINSQSKK